MPWVTEFRKLSAADDGSTGLTANELVRRLERLVVGQRFFADSANLESMAMAPYTARADGYIPSSRTTRKLLDRAGAVRLRFEPDELQGIEQVLVEGAALGACDMSHTGAPRWLYPVKDNTTYVGTVSSDSHRFAGLAFGPWRACDQCSELIERDDYDDYIGLARRALHQSGLAEVPVDQAHRACAFGISRC